MVFIRHATPADSRRMAEIAGPAITADSLKDWLNAEAKGSAWHIAEDEAGTLLGFQHIWPDDTPPPGAAGIATFLGPEPLPPGAAARLFDATASAARKLGHVWISASVGADNRAAQVYYQNRGFRLQSRDETRLFLRYDLY